MIIAYLRVSTDKQDIHNQRASIRRYARKNNIQIDKYISIQISSKKSTKQRRIDELIEKLNEGDQLIVTELSRLGRSVGQIIQIVDIFIKKHIKFIALKENIFIDGKQNIQSKVMVTMFGLFADIERELISERTKQGMIAAREKGKLIGRPKGSLGKSKLDGKEQEIKGFLSKKVSKSSIAKITDVSRTTLFSFIKSRHLE